MEAGELSILPIEYGNFAFLPSFPIILQNVDISLNLRVTNHESRFVRTAPTESESFFKLVRLLGEDRSAPLIFDVVTFLILSR